MINYKRPVLVCIKSNHNEQNCERYQTKTTFEWKVLQRLQRYLELLIFSTAAIFRIADSRGNCWCLEELYVPIEIAVDYFTKHKNDCARACELWHNKIVESNCCLDQCSDHMTSCKAGRGVRFPPPPSFLPRRRNYPPSTVLVLPPLPVLVASSPLVFIVSPAQNSSTPHWVSYGPSYGQTLLTF